MTYNFNRRTRYGIDYHWKGVIKKLEGQMKIANSVDRRNRIGKRIQKARASLLAHILVNS